uniref:Uncharacterized protein n=1 Tax=Anguilla anguilla TaxID=7936 RepID=A0A0E9WZA1_ANGAN
MAKCWHLHLRITSLTLPRLRLERSCGRCSASLPLSPWPGIPKDPCWHTPVMTRMGSMTATGKQAPSSCLDCPMIPEGRGLYTCVPSAFQYCFYLVNQELLWP